MEWKPAREEKSRLPIAKVLVAAIIGVALIILLAFILRSKPAAVTDNSTAVNDKLSQQEQQIASLTAERDALKTQLASQQTNATSKDAAQLDRLLTICTSNENQAKADLKACQENISDNADAVADAGRRLCCIARVNDAGITGYQLKSGRIVCVKSGGTAISC